MRSNSIRDRFDRYMVWSLDTYRAAGLVLPTLALILLLLFLPTVWGMELPTVIVIGVPMTLFAASMLYGSKIEKRVKRRRKSKVSHG